MVRIPFIIRHIDHIVLRVADLRRSVDFYRSALGCEVAWDRPDLGLVHLRAGVSLIDLISIGGPLGREGGAAPAREGRNLDHLCLAVEPFDEAVLTAHLRAHGVTPRAAAARNFGAEGMGWSLYISDPDGNVVELKGPATAAD